MTDRESQFVPEEQRKEDRAKRASELTYPAKLKIRGTVPPEFLERVGRTDEEIRSVFAGERDKTPEDLESIDYCNQLGRRVGEKYGFEWVRVPPDYIHILSEEKFAEFYNKLYPEDYSRDSVGAAGAWPHLGICDVPSKYSRVNTMFHEMCHGESLQRLELLPEEDQGFFFRVRRGGLVTRVERDGKEQHFFTDINEAITSRLTQEAFEGFQDDIQPPESLREESAWVRMLKEWTRKELGMSIGFDAPRGEEELRQLEELKKKNADYNEFLRWQYAYQKEYGIWPLKLSYPNERFEYEAVLNYFQQHLPERFKTADDVHGVFIRAMMNGEILPFARLMEQNFGRGSLRKLGEQGLQWLYLEVGSEERKQGIKPKDNLA